MNPFTDLLVECQEARILRLFAVADQVGRNNEYPKDAVIAENENLEADIEIVMHFAHLEAQETVRENEHFEF